MVCGQNLIYCRIKIIFKERLFCIETVFVIEYESTSTLIHKVQNKTYLIKENNTSNVIKNQKQNCLSLDRNGDHQPQI